MPRHIIETSLLVAVGGFIFFIGSQGDIAASAGTIGVFLSGGFRLTAAMLPLQNALLGIKNDTPTARLALSILTESRAAGTSLNFSNVNGTAVPSAPYDVVFKNVSFSHGETSSFRISKLNLDVEAGSHTALIGSSGSGKSTIADLVAGIFQADSGTVLVGGINPDALTKLRSGAIGYVSQSPGLVRGSLLQNIALGCDKQAIDEERVKEVVEIANLTAVVQKLPDGVNTDLGNHQDLLSGGEIQRLGLARALYPRPGLLILDEATSALDAESEGEINQAIEKLGQTTTVLTIAHRLNTIQNADVVHLIEAGKSIDKGSFQELLIRNAQVRQFVERLRIDG
jgi:ABC-type multidrug transport system fused ATPase/permease subunit